MIIRGKIQLYDVDMFMIIGCSAEEASLIVGKQFKDIDIGKACGTVIGADGVYFLYLRTDAVDYDTIGHEIYHMAYRICRWAGIKNEEAEAWVSGYISAWVYRSLRKHNIEIK